MRASRLGDCAAPNMARFPVAGSSPGQQTNFFDSKKKGSETRWHSIPSHAHGKFDGFLLTSPCGQVAPAIARLKSWLASPFLFSERTFRQFGRLRAENR